MTRLFRSIREYGVPGPVWALMLLILGSKIIWQIYLWLRGLCGYARPSFLWTVCILYFTFWVLLFLLLMCKGKRYSGIGADAVFGGCLLAVAAILHEPDLLAVLSRMGCGAATWVALFGACGLVLSKCASVYGTGKMTGAPSSNLKVGESPPAE